MKNEIYENDDDSIIIKHQVKSVRCDYDERNNGKWTKRFIILIKSIDLKFVPGLLSSDAILSK